jgi:hypothetical protein
MAFPKHLYRCPGPFRRKGVIYAVVGVSDEDEQALRLSEGWHLTVDEAAGLAPAQAVVEAAEALEEAIDAMTPPDRAELEWKARELGCPFNARTSDEKLAERIAEALK